MADATTAASDTTSTNTMDATASTTGTDDTDLICSECGMPLHTLRSGPTGEMRDGGIVWLSVLGCENKNVRGTGSTCGLFEQEQKKIENVVPTING